MATLKERMINKIIEVEGGYVYDPSDSGDETNFGITKEVAVAKGYIGEMIALPRQLAFDIYAKDYWDKVLADDLAKHSEELAYEVVDTGINAGTTVAIQFLQRSLNVFNNRQKYYNDITVDGYIGKATLFALDQYIKRNTYSTLIKALNCLQGSFYIELAEKREKDEKFISGWLKNRVK